MAEKWEKEKSEKRRNMMQQEETSPVCQSILLSGMPSSASWAASRMSSSVLFE
jgi:hypothetical protein